MEKIFNFGGMEYIVQDRLLLHGMSYYRVLFNKQTGAKLYLLCFPGN